MGNRIKTAAAMMLLAAMLAGCGLCAGQEMHTAGAAQEQPKPKRKARPKRRQAGEQAAERQEEAAATERQEETEAGRPPTEEGEDGSEPFDRSSAPYVDNYAYGTLDDATKQVYDEVLTAILGHQEDVEVSTLDVSALEEAYRAVFADYGGLFWVSGYVYTQYTRDGEAVSMKFSPKYTMDSETRERLQSQIDASVDELLAGVSITDSDYEKAKYVFENLIWNVDYDVSVENDQNIISVFLSRATVCQGYACATQYLLRLLGIQSAVVSGRANGEAHAWNLVRLNGNYYYMDATWGNSRYRDGSSQMEKYVNYNYMAVTEEEIKKTHSIDVGFALPDCVSMEENYFVREGRYFQDWSPQAVGAVIADAWDAGLGQVSIKFASLELYGRAFEYFVTEQHITDYCEAISSIFYLEDTDLRVLTFSLRE